MTLATRRAIDRSASHQYTFIEGERVWGPFPGATAICALQDSLGGADGLMNWAVGQALDEVQRHLGAGPGVWEEVRAAAFQAKNGARDIGTAVHSAVDRFNRRLPLQLTEAVAPYLAHYGYAIHKEGIIVLASERYVVNTAIGFGGTYDSLVEIAGEVGPLDVKTGKEKPSQRLQLTGLSMGEWHGEAGLEPEPMPPLDGVGFILLLRPDGYSLIRHEITDADRAHFARLVEAYHDIRRWSAAFAPTALEEKIA